MTAGPPVFLTFAGAGGGQLDPGLFVEPSARTVEFRAVRLPGWRWHLQAPRGPGDLQAHLLDEVARLAPSGPLRFVGVSLGGHLAYDVAVRCQARGRVIEGLCLVDSFFGVPPVPGRVRLKRELARALREMRLGGFLFQHGLRRLLPRWERLRWRAWQRHAAEGTDPWDLRDGSLVERELSMRLLLQLTAPVSAAPIAEPDALRAPALLLRTADNAGQDALWARRCPGLDVAEVPGTHHTLSGADATRVIRERFRATPWAWG